MAKHNGPDNIIKLTRPRMLMEKLAIAILVITSIELALIIALLLQK